MSELNLRIKFPELYRDNLNCSITSTEDFAKLEGKDLIVKEPLQRVVQKLISSFDKNSSVLFFVNEKKILLQQVYKNLYLELKKYLNAQIEYIDSVKPGIFTNFKSSYFRQSQSVFVLLTKNHNLRELRLLQQLKKRKIKVYVLALGIKYYHPAFNIIKVDKIKALYYFIYTLLKKTYYFNYLEFSKLFKFEPKKIDFKAL